MGVGTVQTRPWLGGHFLAGMLGYSLMESLRRKELCVVLFCKTILVYWRCILSTIVLSLETGLILWTLLKVSVSNDVFFCFTLLMWTMLCSLLLFLLSEWTSGSSKERNTSAIIASACEVTVFLFTLSFYELFIFTCLIVMLISRCRFFAFYFIHKLFPLLLKFGGISLLCCLWLVVQRSVTLVSRESTLSCHSLSVLPFPSSVRSSASVNPTQTEGAQWRQRSGVGRASRGRQGRNAAGQCAEEEEKDAE